MIRIELPPPDLKKLNAHNKGHWRSKTKPTAELKALAEIVTRNTIRGLCWEGVPPIPWTAAVVDYLFRVPDRRVRDLANMIQATKPAIDGIVDAGLIVDDKWTCLSIGSVRAEVSPEPATVLTFRLAEITKGRNDG